MNELIRINMILLVTYISAATWKSLNAIAVVSCLLSTANIDQRTSENHKKLLLLKGTSPHLFFFCGFI